VRKTSYGEARNLTFLDRLGEFLSKRSFARLLQKNKIHQNAILDVGCGYNARLTSGIRERFSSCYLADLSINPKLKTQSIPDLIFLEGPIEETLGLVKDESIDFIVANNILEHLYNPELVLNEFRRIVSKKGLIYINVPNWKGKYFLEVAAFRLGLAPVEEMQDHKKYYSKNELWTLIRASNFSPRSIKITTKKFGLNSRALVTMAKE